VDFRKSINGLAVIVEDAMQRSPFSKELYVFTNRNHNRIKILFWEDNGSCLYYKRLQLEEQIRLLLGKRFGASSERHPGQHELFDEAEQETSDAAMETEEPPEVDVASHTKKKPGGKPLPEQLPRVDVIHDLTETRRSLSVWMIQVAGILGPLMVLLQAQLPSGRVLHMDETRVQVLALRAWAAGLKPVVSSMRRWLKVQGGKKAGRVQYYRTTWTRL
jgi:hypothetical protein